MQQNDLKSQLRDAEALYSKATKSELAKRYDQAYESYIRAAELFLHLTRQPGASERDRGRWRGSIQRALDRAEKLKAFSEKGRARAGAGGGVVRAGEGVLPARLTPVAINPFAAHEQYYALKKGSTVNGLEFPLWDESPGADLSDQQLFNDPDGSPKLSPEQLAVVPEWRRPRHQYGAGREAYERVRILPQDVRQHIVTDCSVCASISACLEHGRRFGSHIAESPLHHYCDCHPPTPDAVLTKLRCSQKSGRFDFKILFNGAWRRASPTPLLDSMAKRKRGHIVIDDKLPCNPRESTLMCMSISPDSKAPFTVWPSLLEKAYMKLLGGYDFPGSNSSIDLHAIAGWIPEHVEIHRSDFERERTWQRIASGFLNGRCMVTLGTGTKPVSFDSRLKLLPSHSYAVIDIFEADEGRTFTVLDSWVQSEPPPESGSGSEVCSGATGSGSGADDQSRLINIFWSDALNMFDGMYLSWDPSIWDRNVTFHGMWKRQDPEEVSKQLFVAFTNTNVGSEEGERASQPMEVWVLLTRHVSNSRRTQDFIALRAQVEDDVKGAVVLNQQTMCNKETYTNSTHILARTRLNPNNKTGILSILASYDGDASEVGFTLNVYSGKGVETKWDDQNVATPAYVSKVEGNFTLRTAGGNCTHPSFMVNPQYRLSVSPPNGASGQRLATGSRSGRMSFTVQSSKDMPVNVAVVRAKEGEERVTELAERDLVASSGPYTYGLAKVSKDLPPGEYMLVVSSFDPETLGRFTLKVESMESPFEVKPVPQEGAGMYCKTFSGNWDERTAGGSLTSATYDRNPKFEIQVPMATQFKARLQLAKSSKSTPVPINLTVYPTVSPELSLSSLSLNPNLPTDARRGGGVAVTATSGPYDDSLMGVATPVITLLPGRYWVVPSAFRAGVCAEFRLVVWYSGGGVKVGPGV